MKAMTEIRDKLENIRTLRKIDIVDFRNISKNFKEAGMEKIKYLK